MLLHVLIFQSNDDSVINQGRITYMQALYTHACTYAADYNEYVLCLFIFFMIKRENNAAPKFFKLFSIFQMMFIKKVIWIQWEFSMIRSYVERRNRVALFIRQKQI